MINMTAKTLTTTNQTETSLEQKIDNNIRFLRSSEQYTLFNIATSIGYGIIIYSLSKNLLLSLANSTALYIAEHLHEFGLKKSARSELYRLIHEE